MEKFSKWRDPSTGIQPFLPLQTSPSSPINVALFPVALVVGLARAVLLAALFVIHVVLVDLIFAPLGAVGRPFASLLTAITARGALGVMGYYWITTETVSAKRGKQAISQLMPSSPRKGDLIVCNWTTYVDVLYIAFKHNPVFVLPVFSEPAPSSSGGNEKGSFGRASGTGSASVLLPSSTSTCVGYAQYGPLSLIARTGRLPPVVGDKDLEGRKVYKTLSEARRFAAGPVAVFPEATTSNGRAVLKFGDGVLSEDVGNSSANGSGGIVWIKFIRHGAPNSFLPPSTCPLPMPLRHVSHMLIGLPLPRSANVRTLHPSAAPSSPSFLPSEVLASQPGGLNIARGDEKAAWREALGVVLAETGRVRRVPGMGWVEKASFLEYYDRSRERRRG